jgi:hypothetical protein
VDLRVDAVPFEDRETDFAQGQPKILGETAPAFLPASQEAAEVAGLDDEGLVEGLRLGAVRLGEPVLLLLGDLVEANELLVGRLDSVGLGVGHGPRG